jgi:hypothetical protein
MGKSEVLDDAIASFAMAYADRTAADYAALVKAESPAKAAVAKRPKPRRRDQAIATHA